MKNKKVYAWKNWIVNGILWGLLMFSITGLIYPYAIGEKISAESIFIHLILWLIGGLLFGFVMKQLVKNKVKKIKEEELKNHKQ